MKNFLQIFSVLVLGFTSYFVFADTPPPQRVGVYGIYNGTTSPTLNASQTALIQLDRFANLKVNVTSATLADGSATALNQGLILTELQSFGASNTLKLNLLNTSIVSQSSILSGFRVDNHADLLQIDSRLSTINTNLNLFSSANHSDLLLLNSSTVSNTTILGVKLDTISSNITTNTGSTSAALSTNTSAVTSGSNGIISAINSTGGATVSAINSGTVSVTTGLTTNTQAVTSGSNGIISAIVSNTAITSSTAATLATNQQTQITNQNLLQSTASSTASLITSGNSIATTNGANAVSASTTNHNDLVSLNNSLLSNTASVSQTSINEISAARDGLAKTQLVTSSNNNFDMNRGVATSSTLRVAVSTDPVNDYVNTGFISSRIAVGTSQIEARVGGSPLANRRTLTIYNDSTIILFYGPSGVTSSGTTKGEPLFPNQQVSMQVGPSISIFLITTASSQSAIVKEYN